MNKTQADRMAALVGILENLPPSKFYMNAWVQPEKSPPKLNADDTPKCSTAGCVAGWAAAAFPRFWIWDDFQEPVLRSRLLTSPTDSFEEFFGITWGEASKVCLEGFRMSAKEKAHQLRDIMDGYGWRVKD